MHAPSRNEQQALSLLAHLANAPAATQFNLTKSDAQQISGDPALLPSLMVDNQEALKVLLTTLAHGYRLFLEDYQAWYRSGALMAVSCVETLCNLTFSIHMCLLPVEADSRTAFQVRLAVLLVRTDPKIGSTAATRSWPYD
eukprot:gene8061-8256_t